MTKFNDITPLVSVVMCMYNADRFLRETIDSVLNQTYSNIEFIIVNDGSEDSSADIVRSYSDKRIKYISLPVNEHLCVARNEGVKEANKEYNHENSCYRSNQTAWL